MINKHKAKYFMMMTIVLILINLGTSQTCTRERCCLINPCTVDWCMAKSTDTWNDSTNTFSYTKLVYFNNSCMPCPYDCQTCSNVSTCSTCAKGFYMDNSTSRCMLCTDRCLSCTVVNSITKCSSCQSGTYLDTTTQLCKSCPSGASSCSSSTAIISCQSGYRKSSNSLYCTSCPLNCLACPNSDTVCATCSTGYYLNTSSLCSQCNISNCLTCLRSGTNVNCTSCASGYFVKTGGCTACSSNCKTCTSATVCTVCNSGFYLVSGACSASATTVSNCQVYSSSTNCSTCSSSYFLSSNTCYPCSLLCSTCSGPHFGRCTTCNSNAALFNQMCLITNFPSTSTYNLYFSFPASIGLISSGTLSCASQYVTGTSITINLNNLKAYQLSISWLIYSQSTSTSYAVTLSNTAGNTSSTFSTSSTFRYNNICDNDSSTYYNLDIQKFQMFSSIKMYNTLTFSTSNNVNLTLHEIIITAYRCNDLCVECSSTLCTECLMPKLYTQDAYCVSVCSNNYYIYLNSSSSTNPKQCLSSCPIGSYTMTSNVSCVACTSPCLTCLSQLYCLSCVDGYFLTQDNYCDNICPYKYYGKNQTKTCQKCVGRCLQCIDQVQCLSCNVGFLLNTTKSCVDSCEASAISVNGLYADLQTLHCQSCNANCLNCLYESTLCTQCITSMYLYDSQCLSSCPIGTYAPSSNICQSCSYPCKTCLNTSTNCTSCLQGYMYMNSCLSSCPSGYFEDNINLLCVQCNSLCQQCYGSSNYCLSCKTGYFYYQYGCYSVCPSGNYKNTTTYQCINCVGLCRDCLNQTYCLTCKSNFLYNGTCVTSGQCPSGYFADMTTLSCQPCSNPCKECHYSSTYCTKCDINNPSALIFLENNTCVSSCSSSYFYPVTNSTSATCQACEDPCLTCLSQSLCLSCIAGYKYSNNLCSSTCSIGTYFDSTINDCANCSSNCQICSSSLFCQKCSTNFYINFISTSQNQCVSSCPSTYYAEAISSSCQKCIYPCDTCSSSIDCVTCLTGVAYQFRCISSCPDSTFLQTTTNICVSCDPNCLTCSNNLTYCQSCNDGYFLYSGNHTCLTSCPSGFYGQSMTKSCLTCPSSCSTCVNTTYCLSCVQNVTYMTSTNTCVASCPSGYYGDVSTSMCKKCDPKCLTCQTTSTNCISCPNGYYFIKLSYSVSDCQLSCPSGYYPESSYCYECSFPCNTCSTSSKCLTCIQGTYYFAASESCLLSCPTSTFYNHTNSTCQNCQSPCSSCDNNSTYCLSCSQSNGTVLYLYNGQCVQNCPTKYYSDDSGICNKCYGLCLTCSSKYYCDSCIAGYAYDGFCYSSCPLGTFANTTANTCQPCSIPCSECVMNSHYCTKCTSGLFVYKGNCSSTCPTGTYQQSGECKTCTFPCTNCSSQNTCNECLGGYLLYMNLTCITDSTLCPNDFYKMDSKYCVPITWCPSDYFIDETLMTCLAQCDHKEYTNLDTKKCESSCSSGWYAGVNLVCQSWTVNPPISLMGMSAITYIQSSYLFIEVQFNQSIVWNEVETTMYTLSLVGVRLLQLSQYDVPEYTMGLDNPTLMKLKPSTYPQRINLQLPAYFVKSSATSYPHQNPLITINLPSFTPYSSSQIYSGMITGQFSEGISWFILLLSLFFLFKNRLSDLYVLWDVVQLLYLLIFLDIQYPPNIIQFFKGLKFTHFAFLPSIFPDPASRKISPSPFYAYSYDNSFTRNTGCLFMVLIIVFGIFALLKLGELAIKNIPSLKEKIKQYPQVKGFIYKGILRYRWHHISDVMFLTYAFMMLFAISQIYYINKNSGYIYSNVLSVLACIAYILWVVFVSYKLYKHYGNISRGKMVNNLKCFYRGIQKENKFGVSLVLIRYARKLFYTIIISLFSTNSMFALPILMFTSVLMALFLFINMPYKKKLSNYITLTSEIVLVIIYILLALINFNDNTFSPSTKHAIGWICCILLALMIFALIYQVFCKTMFYLEPQVNPADIMKDENRQKLLTDKQKEYLRKKAEEFFDSLLPRLRERLDLDEDSDDDLYRHYEEGDSENSENNEEREKDWNDGQSHNSDEFKHYDNSEHSQIPTSLNSKLKIKQAPQYLVRCVKDIE